MSVSCEGYIGYTILLKEDLTHEDFRFFEEFEENFGEYRQFDCKGKVKLVVDGMNGLYARLIFVDEFIEECWTEGKHFYSLLKLPVPDDVYNELNKAYKLLYNKELDKNSIEYAVWFHFV